MEETLLKNAQYRKNLSIAFFSATNCAMELTKLFPKTRFTKKAFEKSRDYFLEEHRKYYEKVIAKVGVLYDKDESIEKLKKAKNIEELKAAWRSLSEDERHDYQVRKVVNDLKYEFNFPPMKKEKVSEVSEISEITEIKEVAQAHENA